MPYYVSIGGQTYGPAEIEDLRQWHLAGTLSASDFIWDDVAQAWVEAGGVPALDGVFAAGPTLPPLPSPLGVEDLEELPKAPSRTGAPSQTGEPSLLPETATEPDANCANHPDDAATSICPACRRSLCEHCMVTVDGMSICKDCESEQKNVATRSMKRIVLTWGAPILLLVAMVGAYTFLGSQPAEQPPAPVVRPITRGVAPRLSAEELTPDEKTRITADLTTLAAALGAWRRDTANAAISLDTSGWMRTLSDSGKLIVPVSPPRADLVYRPASGRTTAIEVWTTGPRARAFLIFRNNTLDTVPVRPAPVVEK